MRSCSLFVTSLPDVIRASPLSIFADYVKDFHTNTVSSHCRQERALYHRAQRPISTRPHSTVKDMVQLAATAPSPQHTSRIPLQRTTARLLDHPELTSLKILSSTKSLLYPKHCYDQPHLHYEMSYQRLPEEQRATSIVVNRCRPRRLRC